MDRHIPRVHRELQPVEVAHVLSSGEATKVLQVPAVGEVDLHAAREPTEGGGCPSQSLPSKSWNSVQIAEARVDHALGEPSSEEDRALTPHPAKPVCSEGGIIVQATFQATPDPHSRPDMHVVMELLKLLRSTVVPCTSSPSDEDRNRDRRPASRHGRRSRNFGRRSPAKCRRTRRLGAEDAFNVGSSQHLTAVM
jgi:hypothetical protein